MSRCHCETMADPLRERATANQCCQAINCWTNRKELWCHQNMKAFNEMSTFHIHTCGRFISRQFRSKKLAKKTLPLMDSTDASDSLLVTRFSHTRGIINILFLLQAYLVLLDRQCIGTNWVLSWYCILIDSLQDKFFRVGNTLMKITATWLSTKRVLY